MRCTTQLPVEIIQTWPGVIDVERENGRVAIATEQAEAVARRLLALDEHLADLEIRAAGLAEAFTELTRDDAVASLQEAA